MSWAADVWSGVVTRLVDAETDAGARVESWRTRPIVSADDGTGAKGETFPRLVVRGGKLRREPKGRSVVTETLELAVECYATGTTSADAVDAVAALEAQAFAALGLSDWPAGFHSVTYQPAEYSAADAARSRPIAMARTVYEVSHELSRTAATGDALKKIVASLRFTTEAGDVQTFATAEETGLDEV